VKVLKRRTSNAEKHGRGAADALAAKIRREKGSGAVPAPYFSSSEAAWCLGISVWTLRKAYERIGLQPVLEGDVNEPEHYWWNPHEVARLCREGARPARAAPSPAGARAAEVFTLLRGGATFQDIVIELAMEPEELRKLCRAYHEDRAAAPAPPLQGKPDDDELAQVEAELDRELDTWQKSMEAFTAGARRRKGVEDAEP
jgi:DNA-binding transcriptional MerR regulator